VLVGATIVATRSVVGSTGPTTLTFLRYAVGASILVPVAVATGRFRLAAADRVPVALLGIGQFGVLVLLLNWSLVYISAARAAVLFATMPLVTLVLASLLRQERASARRTVGVLGTIAGVAAVLVDAPGVPPAAGGPWVGDLFALGSALTGAVCSLLYRPYLDRYSALTVGAPAMLASAGVLGVLAAGNGLFATIGQLTSADWLAILFIGSSSAVAYLLWLWALMSTSATNVTMFLAVGPVTAAALGALALHEPITVGTCIGASLVIGGVVLAYRPGDRVVRSYHEGDGG